MDGIVGPNTRNALAQYVHSLYNLVRLGLGQKRPSLCPGGNTFHPAEWYEMQGEVLDPAAWTPIGTH